MLSLLCSRRVKVLVPVQEGGWLKTAQVSQGRILPFAFVSIFKLGKIGYLALAGPIC